MIELTVCDGSGRSLGALRSVDRELAENSSVLEALTRWRAMHCEAFLTRFQPSIERTHRWLVERIVGNVACVLFLVIAEGNEPVGTFALHHLGTETIELGNVMRGARHGPRELMLEAIATGLGWAFERQPSARASTLQVLSDNAHAIAFYERLGYRASRRFELARDDRPDEVVLRPVADLPLAASAQPQHLLEMQLAAAELLVRASPEGRSRP